MFQRALLWEKGWGGCREPERRVAWKGTVRLEEQDHWRSKVLVQTEATGLGKVEVNEHRQVLYLLITPKHSIALASQRILWIRNPRVVLDRAEGVPVQQGWGALCTFIEVTDAGKSRSGAVLDSDPNWHKKQCAELQKQMLQLSKQDIELNPDQQEVCKSLLWTGREVPSRLLHWTSSKDLLTGRVPRHLRLTRGRRSPGPKQRRGVGTGRA